MNTRQSVSVFVVDMQKEQNFIVVRKYALRRHIALKYLLLTALVEGRTKTSFNSMTTSLIKERSASDISGCIS